MVKHGRFYNYYIIQKLYYSIKIYYNLQHSNHNFNYIHNLNNINYLNMKNQEPKCLTRNLINIMKMILVILFFQIYMMHLY